MITVLARERERERERERMAAGKTKVSPLSPTSSKSMNPVSPAKRRHDHDHRSHMHGRGTRAACCKPSAWSRAELFFKLLDSSWTALSGIVLATVNRVEKAGVATVVSDSQAA